MTTETQPPVKILNSIKGTQLEVNVVLMESEQQIGALTKLTPGSVLMFDQKDGEPALIRANGKTFAKGEVVQVGDNYGFKVTELVE